MFSLVRLRAVLDGAVKFGAGDLFGFPARTLNADLAGYGGAARGVVGLCRAWGRN